MKLPLQITVRNLSLSEAAKTLIREKVDKLESVGHELTSCHIQVDAPHPHQLHDRVYDVRIDVTLPGAEPVITREHHEDLSIAIGGAFDAARRRLETVRHRRPQAVNLVAEREVQSPADPDEVARSRQQALHGLLHRARERVVHDIESLMGRRLNEAAIERMDPALDLGDRAALDLSDDVDLALLGMRYRSYKEIADAFRRLGDATYGVCERCAADIPIERLEVEPSARYCVSCLDHVEAIERVEREESRFKTEYTPSRKDVLGTSGNAR